MKPLLLLSALTLLPSSAAGQDGFPGGLEARVEALRVAWGVPGLSLAIVRGDSIVLARGFGHRTVGDPAPVGAETLFAIGSATKAFTSAAVAALVGEGALGWDDPVVDRLPGFALGDPWVTRQITVRDLLAHRSGLPMANPMWQSGVLGGREMVHLLRHLDPAGAFRDGLAYQNVLYLAAGQVVEEASGRPWDRFVRERLLAPLGMTRTRTGVAGLDEVPDVATPHVVLDGETVPVPYRDIDAVGPAGSILSSAADMARWLRFQLAPGTVDGHALVDPTALEETHRPQTVIRMEGPVAAFYPETHALDYGMGWTGSHYRGRRVLDHAGGIDGMTSLVALVPEADLGVAILTNLQLAAPPYWLLYEVLDVLLGHEPVDRSPPIRALVEQMAAMTAVDPPRTPGTRPSLPLEAYAGGYASAPLGDARVVASGEGLALEFGRFTARLEHWHHDTFRARWVDRAYRAAAGDGMVGFRLGLDGRVEALELALSPGETWTFARVVGDD